MEGGVEVYLALGSNLGDRAQTLSDARALIRQKVGTILSESKVYDTTPEGFSSPHHFLNQVIGVRTGLSPLELLDITQDIERILGRSQKSNDGHYQDRTCDIDIILYGSAQWLSDELVIPHPEFRKRSFVLGPLAEIAPSTVDPVTGKTIIELYHGKTCSTGCRP